MLQLELHEAAAGRDRDGTATGATRHRPGQVLVLPAGLVVSSWVRRGNPAASKIPPPKNISLPGFFPLPKSKGTSQQGSPWRQQIDVGPRHEQLLQKLSLGREKHISGVIFTGFFHLKIPLQLEAGEGTDCTDGGNYRRRHRSGVTSEQKGLSDRQEPK